MGKGREATGWPIQGAQDSLGWSGQGGRWARMCQAHAGEGLPNGSVTCSPAAGSAQGLLSRPHPFSAGPESHQGEDCRAKGPPVKPQGKLHAPGVPSCHLCRSPAWTTDSCPVLGIRSLVSFPARLSISQGSAGQGGFLKRLPCPSQPGCTGASLPASVVAPKCVRAGGRGSVPCDSGRRSQR